MNDQKFSVLLYSQFSPNSMTLLDTIKNSKIDFFNVANLSYVCIDNDKIRNKIKRNNMINIKVVPAILTLYLNGTLEIFDGTNAYKWIEDVIQSQQPQPQPQQPQPQQPQPQQPQPQPQQPQPQQPQPQQPQPQQSQQPQQPQQPQQSQAQNNTLIEDLFFEEDETENKIENNTPSNEKKNTKIDILSLAQAMQKDRDKDKETNVKK